MSGSLKTLSIRHAISRIWGVSGWAPEPAAGLVLRLAIASPIFSTPLEISGIKVWETLPDKVFEEADEIELVDLPPLRRVGLAVAVPNAVDEAKRAAHYVTRRRGGDGAVREVIEMILKAQGSWKRATARYMA